MPGRYSEAHQNAQGEGDARPTGIQIVDDEGLAGKLTDKVVFVTGTTSGIGVDTVEALLHTGATVYAAARDVERAKKALGHIKQPGKLEFVEMDQSNLESVRKGTDIFLRHSGGKLNILVCNAGIMAVPTLQHTQDGFESQFGTNHLSHFLLFQRLKDALLSSATPEFSSRVVMLSSSGHRNCPPRAKNGDYNFEEKDSYSPWAGYGQAKTANIWTANQVDRLYGSQNLHANAVMPGGIWTPLQKHVPDMKERMSGDANIAKFMKSTAQGCATTIVAAIGKDWEGKGGKYLEDCEESKLVEGSTSGSSAQGYKAHAFDEEGEKKLWEDSLRMVGEKA